MTHDDAPAGNSTDKGEDNERGTSDDYRKEAVGNSASEIIRSTESHHGNYHDSQNGGTTEVGDESGIESQIDDRSHSKSDTASGSENVRFTVHNAVHVIEEESDKGGDRITKY